eukprot:CAMPEP_0198650418 /NCGR_PEP_ID=MMETSP1467-20131203/4961_1 /TAXON_ID=1462469 /ORGANISM="unid. sp., Strain CCMP2135" /LENGTH=126 /DNA_ID=CAMNT_0044386265 /DNA_START=208 /DNA_END=585 /DNA_ORIENTATION=-
MAAKTTFLLRVESVVGGRRPLHAAAAVLGHADTLAALLLREVNGRTPLLLATFAMRVLLDAGAFPAIAAAHVTPHDAAVARRRCSAVCRAPQSAIQGESPPRHACFSRGRKVSSDVNGDEGPSHST